MVLILFAIYAGVGLQLGIMKGELRDRGAYTSGWNLSYRRVQKAIKKATNEYDKSVLVKAKRLCLLRLGIFASILILGILHIDKKI